MVDVPMGLLRGRPVSEAMKFGMPHVGCHYAGSGVNTHRLDDGAMCLVCGRPATNAHHEPPKSKCPTFLLSTPNGSHVLRPALFALCGSGTTGCHNGFHGGARYKAEWLWDDDEFERMWWGGELLERFGPHSPELYDFGRWSILDKRSGSAFEYRGPR